METLLLKASGPYGIKDSNRFGRDHVKGTSRALTFLRKILKTGYLATEGTKHKLKIVFVHARGIKMYFWKLEIPSEDAQVLEHVISTKIATSSNEIGKILGLGNFIWKLKECSTHSCNSLKKVSREHEEYIVLKQLNSGVQPRTNLAAFVDKEIQ